MEDASLEDFLGEGETEGGDADSEAAGTEEIGREDGGGEEAVGDNDGGKDGVGEADAGEDGGGGDADGVEEGRRTEVDAAARSGAPEDEPASDEEASANDQDPTADGEDPAATVSPGPGETAATPDGDEGVASGTYAFTPGGASCVACGDEVQQLWRDERGLVCTACKSW